MKKTDYTDYPLLILLIIFLGVIVASLASCTPRKKHVVIHAYKIASNVMETVNDDIFMYIIENGDAGCYSTTSNTPITNFSSSLWVKSATQPEFKDVQAEELPDLVVEVDELDGPMQFEVDTEPDNFETDSNTDSGDGGSDGGDGGGGGD